MEHHWHVGGSSGLGTALLRPRHEEKRNKELATNAPPLPVISVLLVSSMKRGFPRQGRSSGNTREMTDCRVYHWFCVSASPGTGVWPLDWMQSHYSALTS